MIVYQHVGWQATVLAMTLIQIVLMVPILLHHELPAMYNTKTEDADGSKPTGKAKVWPLLKQQNTAWFFLFAGLLMVMDQGGLQLRLPMLVDIGLDPAGFGADQYMVRLTIVHSGRGNRRNTINQIGRKAGVRPVLFGCRRPECFFGVYLPRRV